MRQVQVTSEPGMELSRWLCRDLDGERLKVVLWMAAKSGGRFARPMWGELGRVLGLPGGELDPAEREAAALLLIGQAENLGDLHHHVAEMSWMCERCNEDGRYEPALQAWRLLTRAKAVCDVRLREVNNGAIEEIGAVTPALACETWEIEEFWKAAVQPILAEVHGRVWRIGFETMEAYQAIADSDSAAGEGWNRWAAVREAIEPNGRNSRPEDAVIDATRDALDAVEQEGPGSRSEWERRIGESARAANPLLRRIAVFGVERTKHWDDSRKLRWAAEEDRLDDTRMRHDDRMQREVFSLCATAWEGADRAARETFAEKVQVMRRHDDVASERARYRLIGYLERCATSIEELEAQRKALQRKHPEWTVPERPDLDSWSPKDVWIGPKWPVAWTPGNLLREWDSRGECVLDEIIEEWEAPLEPRTLEEWQLGPNEQGRREAIEATVSEKTAFGFALARAWKDLIDPMWDEIVDERGGTTPDEQEALLQCFAYLDGRDQEKFREQFVKGSPAAPEKFLDERYGGKAVENRTAALEVALHCARDYAKHGPWKWRKTLETLRTWKKDPKRPEEAKLIERVLALAGEPDD